MNSLLEIDDLTVSFRTPSGKSTAVKNLSLSLHPGETLAIVGESGSGKSTTAAAINRLLPSNGELTTGRVMFDGQDLAALSDREMTKVRGKGIGYVPQDPMSNLNPLHKIGRQIAEALIQHGQASNRRTALPKVVELLEMVGIPDPQRRADQFPHEFSGGMRQRALIAMGLACNPRLLIADEPTSALDVTVQRKILDRLEHITDELGTAVILITHDLALAAERADRVAVMYRGELVEYGAAQEILAAPKHEYTQRLLSAVPTLTSRALVELRPALQPDTAEDLIVSVEGVSQHYPVRGSGLFKKETFTAVDNVSLSILRGTTVSLVGESGSGKSTTARMVLGLEKPSSGRIIIDGMDLNAMVKGDELAFRRKVQPVFQNPYASLDPRFTIGRSISEPLRIHRIERDHKTKVAELLEQVALPKHTAERFPHELSGGQRQRVAIARALALSPEMLVLDEAVSALDVIVQEQILDLLVSLQNELNLSYFFISHDLAVVQMLSHQVYVMKTGSIVESGSPQEIYHQPGAEYTQELLAAIPGAA